MARLRLQLMSGCGDSPPCGLPLNRMVGSTEGRNTVAGTVALCVGVGH